MEEFAHRDGRRPGHADDERTEKRARGPAGRRESPTAMTGERSTADDGLSLDVVHDLLSNRRRRRMLYCLYRYANPMQLPDVADQVTEWEQGSSADELLDERLHTYTDLYHTHVPKCADVGVVAYDQHQDTVELDRNAAQLRPYLERAAERDFAADDAAPL